MGQQGSYLPKLPLTVFAFLAGLCGPALAENSVALVVGHDGYPNLPVNRQLHKATNDAQSVGVYLAGLSKRNEPSQHLSGLSDPPSVATPTDPAAQAWAATKDTTSQAVLEDFIRQFGSTPYGSMARARLKELKRAHAAPVAPPTKPATPRRSQEEDQKSGVSLASYNGSWVFNMTSSCGFASPGRLTISDGIIHTQNGGGRISPNGSVSAYYSRFGLLNARLVGRMTSSSSGSGSWRNNLGCRGQWSISR
jgi:hypothetical protein